VRLDAPPFIQDPVRLHDPIGALDLLDGPDLQDLEVHLALREEHPSNTLAQEFGLDPPRDPLSTQQLNSHGRVGVLP
tara:strand:- start:194 stop:424 length:231 start_codon:yes stop_codon:yes gene_type:complete